MEIWEDKLINYGEKIKKKHEKIRDEKLRKEMKECTFTPMIHENEGFSNDVVHQDKCLSLHDLYEK